MAKSFRVGSRVSFRTQQGRTGTGKITGITTGARGDWYEIAILSEPLVSYVKVRLAGLS